MRSIFAMILLFLIAASGVSRAEIGIYNECDLMEDGEDRSWCYMGLAEKEKSLHYCNVLGDWQTISQCIDYVAKVTTLTPKHCDDVVEYKQYCLKKLGFPESQTAVWTAESLKKVKPCAELLTAHTQPSPNDYRIYDEHIQTKNTPHDPGFAGFDRPFQDSQALVLFGHPEVGQ